MAAAQKKPAGTAKMTAPRTSTAAKKTQSAAAGRAPKTKKAKKEPFKESGSGRLHDFKRYCSYCSICVLCNFAVELFFYRRRSDAASAYI